MQDEKVEVVAKVGAALLQDDLVATMRDERARRRIEHMLADLIDPDLECVMVAPDYAGPRGRREYRGLDGFVAAWREWIEAYDRYTVELGEVTLGTEGRVLTLGRQRGTTRTGGVEVSEPAAAVWTVRDARLVRAEFHLDPETAKRAAGLGG